MDMIRATASLLEHRPLALRCRIVVIRTHASKQRRQPVRKPNESTAKQETTTFQPIAWYSRKLDTHPILTKAISSGFVSGCGDLLGQYIVYKKEERKTWRWDALRTGRFVLLGAVLVAPLVHVWYASITARFPGTSAAAVAKRVFFDQAFFAPLFLPTWLLNLWILEGRSPEYILHNMQKQIPPMLIANWELWIPAMTVTFAFVPGKFQVLFTNVVAVVWNTYLSYSTHQPTTSRSNKVLEGE